jgi:hypothetical protein
LRHGNDMASPDDSLVQHAKELLARAHEVIASSRNQRHLAMLRRALGKRPAQATPSESSTHDGDSATRPNDGTA